MTMNASGTVTELDHGATHVSRRLYLFQRRLLPLSVLRSSSESASVSIGLTASPIDWNDSEDPTESIALPRISDRRFFKIMTHVGVIVIEEHTCTDRNLSLHEKLSSGFIYEHPGPGLERSQDGGGVRTNAEAVRGFIALEFIGHTTMGNDQLDTILRDLLRVGSDLNDKPKYHSLYWNCHDVAVRFARLAVHNETGLVQTLATMFEMAKSGAYSTAEFANHVGSSYAVTAMSNIGHMAYPPIGLPSNTLPVVSVPSLIYSELSRMSTVMRSDLRMMVLRYKALRNRRVWMDVLEEQFPELRDLGRGSQAWQMDTDQAGRIPRFFGSFLPLLCGEHL